MAWGNSLLNVAADAAAAELQLVSGWDNEMSEVTSRETVTWGAAADGVVTASNQPVLVISSTDLVGEPPERAIAYIYVMPSSGPGDKSMTAERGLVPVVFLSPGTYTLTEILLSVNNPT